MSYVISDISTDISTYSSQHGDFKSYKVRFNQTGDDVIQISQKASTPAPKVGDTLEGSIEETSFGKKFKKDFTPKSGAPAASTGKDPHTMYVSYAKDIVCVLIKGLVMPSDPKFEDEFNRAIQYVLAGAHELENASQTNQVKQIFPGSEPTTDSGGF